jgi:predicted RNA-binding protein YlxR (DUF448 family)
MMHQQHPQQQSQQHMMPQQQYDRSCYVCKSLEHKSFNCPQKNLARAAQVQAPAAPAARVSSTEVARARKREPAHVREDIPEGAELTSSSVACAMGMNVPLPPASSSEGATTDERGLGAETRPEVKEDGGSKSSDRVVLREIIAAEEEASTSMADWYAESGAA